MNNKHVVLHMSLIPKLGPTTISVLVAHLGAHSDLNRIYQFGVQDFVREGGISPSQAAVLVDGLKSTALLEQELQLIVQHDIAWTTRYEPDYPVLLTHTYAPPAVLYWQGASSWYDDKKHLAVIGSRAADVYGKAVIDAWVPRFVEHGMVVVSGGAIGADTMAHQATLHAQGITVSVLGSGLLRPYPSQNKKLFEDIVDSGGIVASPFPLLTQGYPSNFPARNRIISGLSSGCLIVQAALKSGTRITAQFALEQGRNVYAVPGPVQHELSAGCHALIQEGAMLCMRASDILKDYGFVVEDDALLQQNMFAAPMTVQESSVQRVSQKIQPVRVVTGEREGVAGKVIAACKQASSVDELLVVTGLSLAGLQPILFDLQLEGLIKQDFSGHWHVV